MAATFVWRRAHGSGQTFTSGTIGTGLTECNWKNIDDNTTAYTSAPVTAGQNSFEQWLFGYFTTDTPYNTLSAGLFAHTSGTLTNIVLKGVPSVTLPGSGLAFPGTGPLTTTNASLTVNMSAVVAIGAGVTVGFGATSPTAAKTASTAASPAFTNYLTTQMQVGASATAGDHAVTLTLQYDES